jgi:nitrogen regulatory protein P-II 1
MMMMVLCSETPQGEESNMKKVECVVRRNKVDDVKAALHEAGILGMTVTDVRGVGRQKGRTDALEGSDTVGFLPKVKLEMILPDEMVQKAIDLIIASSRTGRFGDGKIFIYPVEQVIRIRTGETGVSAV